MKVPGGLEVDGDLQPGEDPRRWVVQLLKGLYGIRQGPTYMAVEALFRIGCDYSFYLYFYRHRCNEIRIIMPIRVDDLLLASNWKETI